MNRFDRLLSSIANVWTLLTVPLEDRKWRTFAVVKGKLKIEKQSHYDVKKGGWAMSSEEYDVKYVLLFNHLRQFSFKVICKPAALKEATQSDEYLNVIEPWVQGELTTQDVAEMYRRNPEQICIPGELANDNFSNMIVYNEPKLHPPKEPTPNYTPPGWNNTIHLMPGDSTTYTDASGCEQRYENKTDGMQEIRVYKTGGATYVEHATDKECSMAFLG